MFIIVVFSFTLERRVYTLHLMLEVSGLHRPCL
nr:MAG TPA: hypothetical protein [Caudoviricetes sp.]